MAERWTLLTFSRNDGARVVATIDRMRQAVDEVVVVDSSDPPAAESLGREVAARGGRLVRVLPVGNVDLLRSFGLAQVRTEWTIYLDADERPSEALVTGLRGLEGADAFVLDRHELALGAVTQHLRVLRTDRTSFRGPSHGFPVVRGLTRPARPECHLLHDADFAHYFPDRTDRYRSIVYSEWVEHPFDRSFLGSSVATGGRWGARRSTADRSGPVRPLSWPAIGLAIELMAVTETFARRSYRWGRFRRSYERAIAREWAGLDPAERERWLAIARESREAGGLRAYLGLDDPGYLETVTGAFPWDRGGPDVLSELIRFRHTYGHPRGLEPWPAIR